jgi:hypothetical protein
LLPDGGGDAGSHVLGHAHHVQDKSAEFWRTIRQIAGDLNFRVKGRLSSTTGWYVIFRRGHGWATAHRKLLSRVLAPAEFQHRTPAYSLAPLLSRLRKVDGAVEVGDSDRQGKLRIGKENCEAAGKIADLLPSMAKLGIDSRY